MGLRSFIIQEELRLDQAERFVRYKDKYHSEVFIDIKDALTKAWNRECTLLSKQHAPSDDLVRDAQFRNPDALVNLAVSASTEKITSSRSRETLIIAPSAKVPLVYDQHERDRLITKLLEVAEQTFTDLAETWREIFTVEYKGRAVPWFRIVRDHDEVKFQLALSLDANEHHRTLYTVRVEYGRPGSKSKDFDRVYLISLI